MVHGLFYMYVTMKTWSRTDTMAHSSVDLLLGSGERLSENFVNNIADIYRYSKDDIISALNKVTTEKLPLLRIKLYIKLLEIFPEIEDYDLVTRGKKQGLIDDIYEIGNSVNSQKLNKVTDFFICKTC